MIDWPGIRTDQSPYTFRLIEARILTLVVRLAHPEAASDPTMASAERRHRAIAEDARQLWDEIRARSGILDALLSTDESVRSLASALRALDQPWAEYLGVTHGRYVERDLSEGISLFMLRIHERGKTRLMAVHDS